MRIIILLLFSFAFETIFSQAPAQLEQMTQNAIKEMNRQIANLENQIADAKKKGADPASIKAKEDQVKIIKQQIEGIKSMSKNMPVVPAQKKESKPCPDVKWTGFITSVAKSSSTIPHTIREVHIDLQFKETIPTLHRNFNENDELNFTDDKGIGSVTDKGEITIANQTSHCSCTGIGPAELHEVSFSLSDSTYSIDALAPPCIGSGSTDGSCGMTWSIAISNQKLGPTLNILSGTETIDEEIAGIKALVTKTWNLKRACPAWNDPYSEKKITTLKAKVKDPVYKFVKRVQDELCIQLRITHGLRTIQEQNELYAQGRTKPGKIVTNAKGGQSNHNSGLAIDIYMVNCDGKIDLNNQVPKEVVKIAKEEGFEWGGDWKKFKDYPHFEMK